MRDRRPAKMLLALSFLFLGFLIMLHQFMNWGKWFQLEDVHHESFVLACFATALGIYIGAGIGKDERNEQTETIQQPNSDSSRQWLQSSRRDFSRLPENAELRCCLQIVQSGEN